VNGELTADKRRALGKHARRATPREAHAAFDVPADRDPITLLEQQAVSRVPELVPVRYGRMLTSPFAFFRGGALVMAQDLSTTPRSGITVQACGDAHLANFGVFGTPERRLIFDVNDFDETLPGPWEWDVKRLCASLVIAGRHREFTDKQSRAAAVSAASSYRTAMRDFATMATLDVWYASLDIERVVADLGAQMSKSSRTRTAATLAKARTRDSHQALAKLTSIVDGEPRIISDPPLIVPIEELLTAVDSDHLTEEINKTLARYRASLPSDRRMLLEQFEIVQIARKVVGVGSVGTMAWILLLLGHNGDPLFLQAKEAEASVMERFVGASAYSNHGQRVVTGQRLMQASSDIFLGWDRTDAIDGHERDFYFRQLRDWKGSVDLEKINARGLSQYGAVCGWTLARGHARSGDRIQIAAYLGKGDAFDQAVADFSCAYADQNDRDFDMLQQAVNDGRVKAQFGI